MPVSAVWITVALFFILVAVAVPALLQLRRTLAVAQSTLESTGRRADAALEELTRTLEKLDRAATELELGTQKAANLFRALGDLADSVVAVKSSVASVATIGGALFPVLRAAVRAFLGGGEKRARKKKEKAEAEPLPPTKTGDASPHPEPMEVQT